MLGARLIVINDPLKYERHEYPINEGETVARALVRMWPRGLDGSWRIYREEVTDDAEIAAVDLPYVMTLPGETYVLLRTPGNIIGSYLGELLIAAILSYAAYLLTPKPKLPKQNTSFEDLGSTNNALSAQTNQLRAGARVPEIMGRVRSYPDLLTTPIEEWFWPATQTIRQFFCVGMGDHDLDEAKLGDTPLNHISASSAVVYHPKRTPPQVVPPIECLRSSPTVDMISLDATSSGGDVPAHDISFTAATKTMSSPERLELTVGQPINIDGTIFNDADFFVESIPDPSQTTGPYLYTLDGPVVDEPSVQPLITRYFPFTGGEYPTDAREIYFTVWAQVAFEPMGTLTTPYVIEIHHAGTRYRGRITEAYYRFDEPFPIVLATDLYIPTDLYHVTTDFSPEWSLETSSFQIWKMSTPSPAPSPSPSPSPTLPVATDWMVAPLADPDELWIDVAFPRGLIMYGGGFPGTRTITVQAEFKRVGDTDAQQVRTLPLFTAMRTNYLRRTDRFNVADLGLTGTGSIEVRLKRLDAITPDTSTTQYIDETRWASFRAMKLLPAQEYPDVTIVQLGLQNTRSASAIGENAFNVIATRRLPSWDGTAFTPQAATTRWADNFVARCMAIDGAHRAASQLDFAGIYALQDVLDHLDESAPGAGDGAQGQISMTLDTMQDIDSELAMVADVVRAQVYRVGLKLFTVRDQASATRIALFNSRTKGPEAERVAVRMTGDADNDCVIVTWTDAANGYKRREYTYPPGSVGANPARVGALCANWAQAYRRALYDWNRLKYRRKILSVPVTEDGRICRPGDIINVTDDTGNLAQAAGEVIAVAGLDLILDRDVTFEAGTYSIMVRDLQGVALDVIPVTPSSAPNRVTLARAPVTGVTVKGRSTTLGTLYAFFKDDAANVEPWLVTGVEANGPYVNLTGANYTPKVYDGDAATLIAPPPMVAPS
jgi:hypothetical protein